MRRGILQVLSLVILMLASLFAIPAFKSRFTYIATTATAGVLRRTGLEHQLRGVFSGNYHLSNLAPLTGATTTAEASSSSSAEIQVQPAASPSRGFLNGQARIPAPQSRNPFSNMATPETQAPSAPKPETTASSIDTAAEPELPKLSAADFREYNQLAEMMELYVCT